jgi:hypothetical protein
MRHFLALLLFCGSLFAQTSTSTQTQSVPGSGISSSAQVIALFTGCSGTQYLGADGACHTAAGAGTVTAVTVTTANGVSAAVANQGTTPALTFTLGAITPSSIAATGNISSTGAVISGTPSAAALAALPTGSHGFACDETVTAGVPAAAVDYIRCDSAAHAILISLNNGAEAALLFSGGALGTPVSGNGSNLTALNATQLTSGTVPVARIPAIPLTGLATQAADTFLLNATAGSAAPTAVAAPSSGTNGCAGASDALQYNTTTHALGCATISGGSTGIQYGYLTANMSQQSNATLTNITNMTWTVTASKNFRLQCEIGILGTATASVQFALNGNGTVTSYSLDIFNASTTASTLADNGVFNQTTWQQKPTAGSAIGTNNRMFHIVANIQNATTTSLQLQSINVTANITVLADSACTLTQVN